MNIVLLTVTLTEMSKLKAVTYFVLSCDFNVLSILGVCRFCLLSTFTLKFALN